MLHTARCLCLWWWSVRSGSGCHPQRSLASFATSFTRTASFLHSRLSARSDWPSNRGIGIKVVVFGVLWYSVVAAAGFTNLCATCPGPVFPAEIAAVRVPLRKEGAADTTVSSAPPRAEILNTPVLQLPRGRGCNVAKTPAFNYAPKPDPSVLIGRGQSVFLLLEVYPRMVQRNRHIHHFCCVGRGLMLTTFPAGYSSVFDELYNEWHSGARSKEPTSRSWAGYTEGTSFWKDAHIANVCHGAYTALEGDTGGTLWTPCWGHHAGYIEECMGEHAASEQYPGTYSSITSGHFFSDRGSTPTVRKRSDGPIHVGRVWVSGCFEWESLANAVREGL
ncbi:hypothetical protein BXZ70DRAFT_1039831 [Cristinia sonorae]|uniref:Uncharacterized protein n=1 Tax=Cristinia sonorae TaxID=1940300 RepID=A0A8K0UHF0_9AGAR|nr:hypothetical protein BXZ70DRAFT_1039831 [Cristinia sonorae]